MVKFLNTRQYKIRFLFLACFFIASCMGGSGDILNKGQNSYTVISTGSKEYLALQSANKKASKFCKKKQEGKEAVVEGYDSTYQGAFSEQTNQIVDSIGDVARAVDVYKFYNSDGSSISASPSISTRSSDDYQVKLNFSCK